MTGSRQADAATHVPGAATPRPCPGDVQTSPGHSATIARLDPGTAHDHSAYPDAAAPRQGRSSSRAPPILFTCPLPTLRSTINVVNLDCRINIWETPAHGHTTPLCHRPRSRCHARRQHRHPLRLRQPRPPAFRTRRRQHPCPPLPGRRHCRPAGAQRVPPRAGQGGRERARLWHARARFVDHLDRRRAALLPRV